MGRRTQNHPKSNTLPSSPTHSFSSSSSSDFEFTISLSPRKLATSKDLCPADDLFYKGQLLPLHLSPRISMVRTLLLASSSTSSSSDTTTTASRDSTGSSNDSRSSFSSDLVLLPDLCDSSRPSSVTEEDDFKRSFNNIINTTTSSSSSSSSSIKKTKYFSRFSRFSSVFCKESSSKTRHQESFSPSSSSSMKKMSVTAKEVIRKYLNKVKPLYEKLSQKHQQKMASSSSLTLITKLDGSIKETDKNFGTKKEMGFNATSFSGNLMYPMRRRSCVSSCPSSMRSSPSHSGILCKTGFTTPTPPMSSSKTSSSSSSSYAHDASSMEELQNAIQGAIAHCKNSMLQNKTMVSYEI